MNWARWQWRWRLFRRRQALRACPACRALVPRSTRSCPECGARQGWRATPGRPPGTGLFAESPATGVLLVAIAGLFLVTWALSLLVPRPAGAPGRLAMPGDISGRILFRFGAYHSGVFQTREYWRLLTGIFLHGGLPHILFNAAALYSLGREVESVYGWARTLLFFLGAGAAGSTCSVLLNRLFLVGIGASGAVFGLIGVVAVFGYRRGGSYGRGVMRTAVQWAAIGLVYGFLMDADNMAHLGGLAGGALLALVVPPERERVSPAWNAAGVVAAALVPVAFALVLMGGS